MTGLNRLSNEFSDDERKFLLKQYEASGLKYDEFAREHNINAQTFKNWIWISKRGGALPNRYTPVERKKIVESYLSSDMKKMDFCKTWGVSSGTLLTWVQRYHEFGAEGLMQKPRKADDKRLGSKTPEVVQNEIIQIKKEEPSYGIKKIKNWLFRYRGVKVSTGTVRRTVVENGLPLVARTKKRKKSSDRVRRFERARPMQLWQSDITQRNIGVHSMRVYLTIFMDDHSRYIVGWRLHSRQTADLVLDAFKDAMVRFGKPEEVLTDQGRQYFAWRGKSELEKVLEKENIKHVVSRAHHPQTLGKCERFWETLTNEFWTRVKPGDLEEARQRLKYFIDHYNHQRPHQGLNGEVPADRFFGIAEEVREAIQKTVEANSLKLAIGELPKPPAFLIGQVGDQRIAFHGTSGGFYLTHENLKKEEINAGRINDEPSAGRETSDIKSRIDTPQLQTPERERGIAESSAVDTTSVHLGASDIRGSGACPENIDGHNGILDGKNYETSSCGEVGDETHTNMAIKPASDIGDECGIINTATNEKGSDDENK